MRTATIVSLLAAGPALLGAMPTTAQQRTTINPVDIDYRYNFEQINDGASYGRDAAWALGSGAVQG